RRTAEGTTGPTAHPTNNENANIPAVIAAHPTQPLRVVYRIQTNPPTAATIISSTLPQTCIPFIHSSYSRRILDHWSALNLFRDSTSCAFRPGPYVIAFSISCFSR